MHSCNAQHSQQLQQQQIDDLNSLTVSVIEMAEPYTEASQRPMFEKLRLLASRDCDKH